MRRDFLAGSLSLMGLAVLSNNVRAQETSAAPAEKLIRIRMTTAMGDIVLDLDAGRAPLTTANFLRYVDQKKLDASVFYRAMKSPDDRGLVQGGDSRRAMAPVAHEPTSQTGLSHTDGTISLVRGAAAGSGKGDFFICVGDMTFLDAGPDGTDDKLGFAAFGKVVEGMDVVRAILAAPTSATEGVGAMQGQMLAPKVPIVKTRRV
jgi:peptidyl-prolyl cis-trans isomerase A (cyclophilin A)